MKDWNIMSNEGRLWDVIEKCFRKGVRRDGERQLYEKRNTIQSSEKYEHRGKVRIHARRRARMKTGKLVMHHSYLQLIAIGGGTARD